MLWILHQRYLLISHMFCSYIATINSRHSIHYPDNLSDQCLVVYCLSTCDKSLAKLYLKGCQPVLMETVMFLDPQFDVFILWAYGLFTLHGTGTGGIPSNGTSRIGNNWVSLNVFNEFTEFSDKNICYQKGSNLPPLMLETGMLPQCQQDTCNRQDL